MFTLDTNFKKASIHYLVISIISLIASIIYLKLSFGVSSFYMKYFPLIPFLGGTVFFFGLSVIKIIKYNRLSYNLYNAAIATITVGSIIKGILDISGSHSFYLYIYKIVTAIFFISAVVTYIFINLKHKSSQE